MPSHLPRHSVCTRCLGRHWLFPPSSQFHQSPFVRNHNLPLVPPSAGYARLTDRALISVTGADSTAFLQGMITQSILIGKGPVRGPRRTGFYSAFLNAQGRVLHDVFIYPSPTANDGDGFFTDGHSWLIEVDKAEVQNLMKHLKKYKLRAKFSMRALNEGERSVWASWNEQAESRWAASNPPTLSQSSSITACTDTRAPSFGSRIVTPGPEDLRTHLPDDTQLRGTEVQLDTYTLRRILHGVAEGQMEIIRESALPIECNMDLLHGIDFHKGCYVGQELTIRTRHTGIVRKRILPVQLYNGGQDGVLFTDAPTYDPTTPLPSPPRGADISRFGARKGRSAGKFLGGIGNIGLALCRLEMMTDIVLTGEGSQYSPLQEFKVSWDGDGDDCTTSAPAGERERNENFHSGVTIGEVKIKALVPPWTREYILAGAGLGPASTTTTSSSTKGNSQLFSEDSAEARSRRYE